MIMPDFCKQMNQIYPSICHWPHPYTYMQWYHSLDPQYHSSYLHPDYYNLNYDYYVRQHQKEQMKPPKLSRTQKRGIKKRQLKEELEKERKLIGKWVDLERKDLINDIDSIEQKEKRMKEKKRQRFSHLIEIHKEVYKHYLKKGCNEPPTRRVSTQAKKKRLSYIKRMKHVFESRVNAKEIDNHDDGWESVEEEDDAQKEQEDSERKEVKETSGTHSLNISVNELETIKYMETGKLTGRIFNNVVLREWVRNVPNQQLEDIALKLINRLAYKQAVRKVQKPTKAKKLIVSGIKECKRTIDTIIDKNRCKMLIVALNIERNPLRKGVDDEVQTTIQNALHLNIPIVHTSTRAKLGRAFTGKFGPRITIVSIINFQGYQDMMEELITHWKEACIQYNAL